MNDGLKVVFTGPAINNEGRTITRENLKYLCQQKGMTVHSSIRKDTELLVASRKDTVKAKQAAQQGVQVMTYPEFLARAFAGEVLPMGGIINPYTDKLDPDSLVPSFTHLFDLNEL